MLILASDKAAEPDAFRPTFYKPLQSQLKQDASKADKVFFPEGWMLNAFDATFITVLIVQRRDYRSIYKTI